MIIMHPDTAIHLDCNLLSGNYHEQNASFQGSSIIAIHVTYKAELPLSAKNAFKLATSAPGHIQKQTWYKVVDIFV